MQIKMKKLAAVTLVELLAVLTIMGVVTALTLPGLKKHSQKSEYAALAQKGFVTLEHAIDMANAELDEEIGTKQSSASFLMRGYIGKYFNGAKNCIGEYSSSNACFKGYTPFAGGNKITPYVRAIILADGVVIAGHGNAHIFYIDVNADAPPNREGVDVFLFNYGKYNANCVEDETNGQWKLCPVNHAKNLMEDGWKINYY